MWTRSDSRMESLQCWSYDLHLLTYWEGIYATLCSTFFLLLRVSSRSVTFHVMTFDGTCLLETRWHPSVGTTITFPGLPPPCTASAMIRKGEITVTLFNWIILFITWGYLTKYACMHACVCMYVYVSGYVCMYIYILYICVCVCLGVCMYVYIYIIYMCVCVLDPPPFVNV